MSADDTTDSQSTSIGQGATSHYYQQLGAPTLIYEGHRCDDSSNLPVDSGQLRTNNATHVYETLKRKNRARVRWEYSLDVDRIAAEVIPNFVGEKASNPLNGWTNSMQDKPTTWRDKTKQQRRLVVLSEGSSNMDEHRKCIKNYQKYDYPYRMKMNTTEESKIKLVTRSKSEAFAIHQQINSDSSLLAPFDFDSINDAVKHEGREKGSKKRPSGFRRKVRLESSTRLPQGNTLLSVPCPCHSCSKSTQGYVLLHAKGKLLERLCVSNLIPPLGTSNASETLCKDERNKDGTISSRSNEICLDETILDICQCGTWNAKNQECIFAARTSTHISVIRIQCTTCNQDSKQKSICSGCYVMKEVERIDLRSFSPKLPSFIPVSLASHPRYGNILTPSKFAFVSHTAEGSTSSQYNVVHSCTVGAGRVKSSRHDINNLRTISLIDFSSSNPMCLWSAALSYVRPSLAPGAVSRMQRQTKSPFGLGSSLFSIDLRSNSGTFQWSPSAEEMVTEGVHSINAISTDWGRDNVVFATSLSAGKTWEIDARMPCAATNSWSLTGICEEYKNIALPSRSFYGEPTLLARPVVLRDTVHRNMNPNCFRDLPILKVDTNYGANGIHLFQRPLRKPRFQTESLECIGVAGLDASDFSSVAKSSYFELTEISQDNYICGISAVTIPLREYVSKEDTTWSSYLDQDLDVLCTLTMNNNGDIFSHSLLQYNDTTAIANHGRRFEGLPVGTKAIKVPENLDGRTKFLTKGHRKTGVGGMNLRLFLSNKYPASRKAAFFRTSDRQSTEVDNNDTISVLPSRKKRIDNSGEVVRITNRNHSPGLIIAPEDSDGATVGVKSGLLPEAGSDRTLVMPLSFSKGVQTRTKLYRKESIDDDLNNDATKDKGAFSDDGENNHRSDLSKDVIESALDDWEDVASESSNESKTLRHNI